MEIKKAKKLHNKDEVEVRLEDGTWARGAVVGDVFIINGNLVVMDVQIHDGEFLRSVNHTKIR